MGHKKYEISDLGTRKNEIMDGFENVEDNDLEDLVFRKELTYREIEKYLM